MTAPLSGPSREELRAWLLSQKDLSRQYALVADGPGEEKAHEQDRVMYEALLALLDQPSVEEIVAATLLECDGSCIKGERDRLTIERITEGVRAHLTPEAPTSDGVWSNDDIP